MTRKQIADQVYEGCANQMKRRETICNVHVYTVCACLCTYMDSNVQILVFSIWYKYSAVAFSCMEYWKEVKSFIVSGYLVSFLPIF